MSRRYIYAAIAALFGVIIGMGGPGNVEALLFPIKKNHSFTQFDSSDGSKVCISMDISRLRGGPILFRSWTLQTRGHVPQRITLHMDKVGGAPPLKAGEREVVTLCAPKPDYLKNNPHLDYIIYGYVFYEVWHGLWQVPWHICEEHHDGYKKDTSK